MSSARTSWPACLALCMLAALPWSSAVYPAETALFTDKAPLDFELRIDLDALCRELDQVGCEDVSATLIYRPREGGEEQFSIDVRTRGEWRLNRWNCKYPPLFLVFGDDTPGTLLEGQDLLPLTTHCSSRNRRYQDYVLREYLAYQIYQMLTEKSVRTRLVRIRYADPSGRHRYGPYFAFLSEHFRSMADRNHARILKVDSIELSETDPMEMATMDLFQYMIGNTDWSALALHNILPIRALAATAPTVVSPVPFDFDFSGLVSAEYATPPPDLPIKSTRQRYYRGFCNPAIDWDALFAQFQDIRPQVFDLLDELPGITRPGRRSTRAFLKDFYSTLGNPERRQKRIVDACR
jgi:hypothetical protein